MSRQTEDRIAGLAARQHGIVTRAQLLASGLSPPAIRHRVRGGRLCPLHRGVYRVGPIQAPHAREMAAVLAGGPGALLSHLSAAVLHGLMKAPRPWTNRGNASERSIGNSRPPARRAERRPRGQSGRAGPTGRSRSPAVQPVDITIPADRNVLRPGIRVHRTASLDPDERMVVGGVPITTPGRTLMDMTVKVGIRELETMVARAQRAEILDEDRLFAMLERYRGRPGIAALRAVMEIPGGPAMIRSEAESRFLALVRKAGLPTPRANLKVGRYELDFFWPHERIAVEVDGYGYHSSRTRFEGDRRRDAWLNARGFKVIRLSWRQIVESPVPTIVQVGQALAKAGR